jgi:hypothetical protein
MRRQFPLGITVVVLACASGQSSTGGASAAERERVVNLVPFDLANCFPQKLDLGKTANEYTLQAAFRAARPAIGECLVDAKLQNPAVATKGKVTIGMDPSGTTIGVHADGVKPEAITCIETAVRKELGGVSLPANAKPISLDAPIERDPAQMVRMGVNESSDVVGAIRLALPQWCSCFDSLRTQAPPELAGPVSVVRPDVAQYADRFKAPDGGVRSKDPVQPTLTAAEPSGAQAASCVNERIAKMSFKTSPEQLVVPVQLLLLNSSASKGFSAATPPPMQFAQLDAIREQRQADAFAALARRQNVANTYDAQVQAYQAAASSKDAKKRSAAGAMVSGLKTGCAELVKADDAYTKALEEQAAVEQQAVTLAQTLKAKDPVWGDAEKAAAGAMADTQKQIDAAKQLRAANEKACPKAKF